MFAEVDCLATEKPSVFGEKGAYARAYSLFGAALGMAILVGPGWSGAVYEMTSWPVMAATLAFLCALGGIPVYYFTGNRRNREGTSRESTIDPVEESTVYS